MLARVAEMLVRPFLPLVGALEDRLEELEEMALRSQPRVVTEVQALRRDTARLRRFVAPQREVVLAMMREEATPLVGRRARQRFSDVYELVYRTVESLDSDRLLLAAVLDTYRSAVADETNRVIKVLTIFSATLLPLTLIAGIYGMNFEHMPELEWRFGYAWALGLMAAVASGLWVWFARKGFIGGPRLRDLPRAVGMGLLHAATLPAKGVRRLNQRSR
jgi:magnesium transporter